MTKTMNYKTKELEGDMLTPIMLYHQLTGKKRFLLESSYKHEQSGRYSFLGMNPVQEFLAKGKEIEHRNLQTGESAQTEGHSLEALKAMIPHDSSMTFPFPFFGGAVGYMGYDVMFLDEVIGEPLTDELGMPDIHFMFYDTFIVYDHLLQKVTIAAVDLFENRTDSEMEATLEEMAQMISREQKAKAPEPLEALTFTGSTDKDKYSEMVLKAKDHIVRGDIFQVVLSQRLKAEFKGDPFTLYRRLRTSNPSPYMFYIDFADYTVLGASPESLITVSEQHVMTNPIAGTRPRGKTEEEDANLAAELLADEKEIAEHMMLVDLSRNDIGKVSEIGSVHLTKYKQIEKYKHVMHIVSEVSGTLKEGIHPIDALASCLPAGTVSGAPKIRAMQIINELESMKRGLYSGAVGYITANGNLDFALAIRTMIVKDDVAYVQAGAGVVYDSVPEKEYEETMHKAKALLEVKS